MKSFSSPNAEFDDYPTCSRTYASILVFTENHHPDIITQMTNVISTDTEVAGQLVHLNAKRRYSKNIWRLSSMDHVNSKDLRKHLDWVFSKADAFSAVFEEIERLNFTIRVLCFWASAQGQGGPILSLPQLRRLVDLKAEIDFDIVFESD